MGGAKSILGIAWGGDEVDAEATPAEGFLDPRTLTRHESIEVETTGYVSDPAALGWSRYSFVGAGPSTPVTEDQVESDKQAKAEERRQVIALNKLALAATEVRRQKVTEFLARKTLPKGKATAVAAFLAETMWHHHDLFGFNRADGNARELATEFLGGTAPLDAADGASAERLQIINLDALTKPNTPETVRPMLLNANRRQPHDRGRRRLASPLSAQRTARPNNRATSAPESGFVKDTRSIPPVTRVAWSRVIAVVEILTDALGMHPSARACPRIPHCCETAACAWGSRDRSRDVQCRSVSQRPHPSNLRRNRSSRPIRSVSRRRRSAMIAMSTISSGAPAGGAGAT